MQSGNQNADDDDCFTDELGRYEMASLGSLMLDIESA
jgi:hypothetical protein